MELIPLAREFFTPGAISEPQALELEQQFRSEPSSLVVLARMVADEGRAPISPVTVASRRATQAISVLEGAAARDSLEAIILSPAPEIPLQWLHDAGLLRLLVPDLEATVEFTQEAGRKHKDVWEHTKLVVRQAPARAAVRWAALLHDIGKVPTRRFLPDGRVHFHRHAEVGARMFDAIARRFAFERSLQRAVRFLILHHLRANQYVATWTESAVRRFDREMGDHLQDLLDLSRADVTSRREERRREAARNIDQLRARITDLRAVDARLPTLPTGIGDVLMRHYKAAPGRWVGDFKRALEAAIERGELEPRREAEYYVAWIDAKGLTPPS